MQLWLPAGSTARAATARAALLAAGAPACMGLCGLRASEHSAIQLSPQQPPLQDMTKFIKKHAKVPFELPKKKKKGEAGGAQHGLLVLALHSLGPIQHVSPHSPKRLCAHVGTHVHCTVLPPGTPISQLPCPSTCCCDVCCCCRCREEGGGEEGGEGGGGGGEARGGWAGAADEHLLGCFCAVCRLLWCRWRARVVHCLAGTASHNKLCALKESCLCGWAPCDTGWLPACTMASLTPAFLPPSLCLAGALSDRSMGFPGPRPLLRWWLRQQPQPPQPAAAAACVAFLSKLSS